MNASLKTGWAPCRLGEVLTLVNGRAYKLPEMLQKGTPILRIQNLNGGNNWFYSDLALPDDKYCIDGDLLYAWSATFGPYIYQGPKAIFHYHIWNVHPSFAVEKKFAFYELMRITDGIKQAAHGVAMPHITKAGMEDWELNLPPLPEQKRIANKLDSVLARVDACRDRLDRLPALLKRFRQSILAAATSGRLTEDWRSGKSPSWEDCKLGDLLKGKPRNGYSPKAVDYCTPVKSLTLSATTSGKFKSEHIKFIDESIPADSHLWLKPNDILIQRANTLEYVGVSAIFQEEAGQYIYPDLMMKCEANQKVLPEFLLFTLSTESTRTYFRENATGTAGNMPKINQQTVVNAPALLPPFGEQTEIVRRVELLFAFADRLEARLAAARRQVGQLTPALLAKAFRGELVPQDPADEPATELLKRLAAQRETAPKARRGRASKA